MSALPEGGFEGLEAQSLLDAMADIAYVVDVSGRFLAVGGPAWREVAQANGAEALYDSGALVGSSLFDAIADDETRQVFRGIHSGLLVSGEHQVAYHWRCDAPCTYRSMRMTVSLVRRGEEAVGFLYHSQMLETRARPTVGLLSHAARSAMALPLMMCSFCRKVRYPAGGTLALWVEPERYYRLGGTDAVRLLYEICPACRETTVAPLLDRFRRRAVGDELNN
jgi:hypothetical protein